MYTYTQLLARNTFFGLAIFICVSIVTVLTLDTNLSKQQINHKQSLLAFSETILLTNDVKKLTQTLRKSTSYEFLSISTSSGENLYNYKNDTDEIKLAFITPAVTKVTIADKVIIQYQLSSHATISLIISLLASYLGFTVLLIIFSSLVSKHQYHNLFLNISDYIKTELAIFTKKEHKVSPVIANFNIPELTEGLEEIKQIMSDNAEQSSVLKEEAYTDRLTHFDNRNSFIQFFQSKIADKSSEINFGVMLISRCSELQTINKVQGYKEGDHYIIQVADILKKEVSRYQGAKIFRLNSSDFATILPNVTLKEAENYAQALTSNFNHYQQSSDLDSVAYTGLVSFTKDKPLGELLALTDTAISVAQTQNINTWYAQKDTSLLNNPSANYGNQNWRQEIERVLENQAITLVIQPIKTNSKNKKMYGEVLARFLNTDKAILPTASFIAMAEKLDKIVAVDRMIIDTVLNEINNQNLQSHYFGINISSRSIHDEHFLIWLERRLLRDQNIASNLVFELTELGLQQNIKTSKRFIDMIHRVGARITVERFGVGLTSFKFFKELKPDFIKMDSSYTRDIDEDKNNQYFIRVMVDLAHRLSINVLAESVETMEEKHTLEELFIDGCQGYYIGKPEPM